MDPDVIRMVLICAMVLILASTIGKLWVDIKILTTSLIASESSRARAEERVMFLERELEDTDHSRVWIVSSVAGVILDAGGATAEMLLCRSTELIGKEISILIPPELRKQHKDGLAAVAAGAAIRVKAIPGEALRSNGSRIPVIVSLRAMKRCGERVVRAEIFHVSSDININSELTRESE